MSANSKRGPWQIHLISLIVLMFIASVLLFLNTRERFGCAICNGGDLGMTFFGRQKIYGWPYGALGENKALLWISDDYVVARSAGLVIAFSDGEKLSFDRRQEIEFNHGRDGINFGNLFLDALCALALLASSAVISEFLIWRESAVKRRAPI